MKNITNYLKSFNWISIVIILSVIGLGMAFTSASEDDPMPAADAEELWTFITETKPYTQWDNWPGLDGMYEGQSPHGAYLKLYINEITNIALLQDDEEMPLNAILVKENYDKNKNLVAITPMYKVDAYNPEAGNWFWAKYSKDGKIMAEGKVQSCIACHTKVKDDDYVFTISKELK